MCTSRLTRTILLAGIAMLSTASTGRADPPQFVTAVEGIAEFRLDNGLKVLLFVDPSKPQVTVNLTVFVGSRHEGYGEAGMAHLLEHMLFKGTPEFPEPNSIPKALKDHGAVFNGTTWLDRTNYYETLPASEENLEFAIRLEADRLVNSFIKAEDLESEMTVVRNEFERGEDSPSSILAQRMMAAAFEWHNYGKSTIGNRADIERVPIENLRAFYRKYYRPDNAMLIIAGQFDPEQALALVQEHFGAIPAPEEPLRDTYTEEPPQDGERLVTLRRVGDVAMAGLMYHIPSGPHPDYVSIDVLEHILTGSPSGRLYKALVETQRASSVTGAAFALHDPGILRLMAEVAPGNDPHDVLSTMTEVVETVAEEGVTEEEVERSKLHWMKQWEQALNDSARVAIQLSEWAAQGDWRLMFLYRDRLEEVTPESVQAVAEKYLERNNRTVGLFLPTEKPQRSVVPPTPDLAEMIGDYQGREGLATGEAFDVSAENIQARTESATLPSGVKAAFLPKETRGDSVKLRLTLRFGDEESLSGRLTACEVLPGLMMRGTKEMSRAEIQDALNRNRGTILPTGAAGELTFTVEARRDTLPAVLDILRQILREPTLPAEELDIVRTQLSAAYAKQLTDPTALAQNAISRAINPYPPEHPRYVHSIPENVARFEALELSEVVELYEQFLGGTHGELAVVGDFDTAEVRPIVEEMLADWTSPHEYAWIERTGRVEQDGERIEILTPDKENATYFAATVFPMDDQNPDYGSLVIAADIFGGSGLSSRLGNRVRQNEGLSYGVGAFLTAQSLDERTTFAIYAITNPANMGKVEAVISEELALLLEQGVTAEELAAAQTGYLERQKVNWSNDAHLALALAGLLQADRDMTYYAVLRDEILGLSAKDVNAAFGEWIVPEQFTLAVAGDFAPAEAAGEEAGE
ncbi:MAG: insulinase family protein [Planctomycetota bacterium]|nr:MAG: insulinase family protein [Planctomycetota bacterium]